LINYINIILICVCLTRFSKNIYLDDVSPILPIPAIIHLQGSDLNNLNAELTASIISPLIKCTLDEINQQLGTVIYIPSYDIISNSGTNIDTFTYKVSDSKTDSNTATVTINVNPAGSISKESNIGSIQQP
jgi:hypothetical protein